LRRRRSGELFALLLLNPGRSLLFDQVSEALWPDRDPEATRTLFHHACAGLRKALEPDLPDKMQSHYLSVEEGCVALKLPPGSHLDYQDFEAHCQICEWQAAVDLYAGEFLPDFLYAEWTQSYRQRFLLMAQEAMLALGMDCLEQGKYQQALDFSRRVLHMEPWHEQATLIGMRASLELNHRSGALRLYKNLEKALQNELSVPPSAELNRLYRDLTRPQKTQK
jgi:DNA-binding SARP family transcriptional activator